MLQFHYFFVFHVTKGWLNLLFYAGKNAYFSFAYEKVHKTDSLEIRLQLAARIQT